MSRVNYGALDEIPLENINGRLEFDIDEAERQPVANRPHYHMDRKTMFLWCALIVFGVTVTTALIYLLLSHDSEDSSHLFTTFTPNTTFFSTPPDTTTATLTSTTGMTTETIKTTTALPTTSGPTPDPRCKFFPDCCDMQGQWICTR